MLITVCLLHSRCKKKCYQQVATETKAKIIDIVNQFANKDEQDIYLQGLIESKPVQNTRNRKAPEDSSKHKSHSYTYYVNIEVERKEVYKKAFISLHGITLRRVYRLSKLKSENIIPRDLRGTAST